MVRRIRGGVDELNRNKHVNHTGLECITQTKEAVHFRKPNHRGGTGDLSKKNRHPSSIHLDPGEAVIIMERNEIPDSQSNVESTQVGMENILTIQNPTVTEIQAIP